MLVFGSRMYFRKNVVKSHGECEHCGRYGKQQSYRARKFGHLYFIPILPEGPRSQILNECSHCNMGAHIPLDKAEPLIESTKERFKDWIMKVQEGQREVVPDGGDQPINIGLMIAGTAESLYCLDEIKDVDSICQILDGSGFDFERSIVQARWCEMQGNLNGAVDCYKTAANCDPKDEIVWVQLGKAEKLRGNALGAEQAYHKYLESHPDDVGVHADLAGIYEAQKDWPKIVQAYDKLYTLHPPLLQEKPMKKLYKKACKKSGEQGKFLNQF